MRSTTWKKNRICPILKVMSMKHRLKQGSASKTINIYSLSSYVEHSSFTVLFHCSLSWAWCSIWVHRRPICRSSCSADLLQLFLGLPRFLFPCGFQKSACLVTLLCGFLSVWPIHFHFFLLIWTIILSSWVFAHKSSLLIVFGHLTPRM